MKRFILVAAVVLTLGQGVSRAAISVDMVTVDNAGNTADSTGYGAVGYEYRIGKYEVTAGQYTEFLNAVADTDTYGLYASEMWSSDHGCKIEQSGSSGSYSYSVEADWADRPVNYVSWGDAARFANWLHNGQLTGEQDNSTTEDGAYYLNGATSNSELMAVSREADWKWAIPTEDEWYKAAYHKNDGVTGNYYLYPTSSNAVPSNELDLGGNNATFYSSGYTIDNPCYRTEVGAHENSDSPYDTFDQGGNVWEWNEATIVSYRGLRGGYFDGYDGYLQASWRDEGHPPYEDYAAGFRVASIPEPSTLALLSMGVFGLLAYAWRKNKQV